MGVVAIIVLSTLPYLHDFITDSQGLRTGIPVLGIENLLTDSYGDILGFSVYRVFLYTFFIFVFAAIGWAGWYKTARGKYYRYALLIALSSGMYHLALIVFNLRRSVLNDLGAKLAILSFLFLVLGYLSYKQHGTNVPKTIIWLVLMALATLPFLHDILTERDEEIRNWVPDLGIQGLLTDSDGMVRGLRSYRLLLYLLGVYIFSHLGWIGWFMEAKGKKYRVFLLVPAALSLYQVLLILASGRETEFNSPSTNLYITIVLSILLAINFFYNNKVSPQLAEITKKKRDDEN